MVARRVRQASPALLAVLIVAAVVRLLWPALYQFKMDEFWLMDRSLRLARHGEWTWLSNKTNWSVLPIHSPLNTYIVALPYLITPDPRAPRVLVGLLGVAATGVLYAFTRRAFGPRAALITGLLFALSPFAVEWSRFVWNPNIAQPFIALWMLTGLLGYIEGRRWARIGHWLALSVAVQAHLGLASQLGPLSLLLVALAWVRQPAERRALIQHTALGAALAAVTCIPWVIGLLEAGLFQEDSAPARDEPGHTFQYVRIVFSSLASGTDYWSIARAGSSEGNWWPPLVTEKILWARTWLTLAGLGWLAVTGWRRRWDGVPRLLLVLLTLWPLVNFLVSPIFVVDFYLMPIMFGAVVVQGAFFARLSEIQPWTRWPVAGAVLVLLALQVWLLAATWRWLQIDGVQEPFRAPMSLHMSLLDEWAQATDGTVTLLTETKEAKYDKTEQEWLWDVIGESHDTRVVRMPQGIPIDPRGQIAVGTLRGNTIPALFGEGNLAGEVSTGEPIFRWIKIPPGYQPALDYVPETIAWFDNGARILGIEVLGEPQPGQPWPLRVIWQPEVTDIDAQFQFSVRAVDADGKTYGQADMASLSGWLWRAGDTVINPVEIPLSEKLPDGGLRIQLLMYTLPDMRNANAIDEAGGIQAPWLFLAEPRSRQGT